MGVTFAVVAVLLWLLKSPVTKPFMDRLKLKLPVIKSLVFKSGMARASQTLASLVSAGVPILRGLEMAEKVSGNDVIRTPIYIGKTLDAENACLFGAGAYSG